MQMIADGKIKAGTKIAVTEVDGTDTTFEYDGVDFFNNEVYRYLYDHFDYSLRGLVTETFEILEEDTTEEIKPIDKSYGIFGFNEESFAEMKEMVQDIYEKTEELVIAYDKLNNTTYKAENCMTD